MRLCQARLHIRTAMDTYKGIITSKMAISYKEYRYSFEFICLFSQIVLAHVYVNILFFCRPNIIYDMYLHLQFHCFCLPYTLWKPKCLCC